MPRWVWPASFGILACAGSFAAAKIYQHAGATRPSDVDARALVDRHCVPCHSQRPTVAAFPIAPKGVMLDTAEQLKQYAERIRVRTLVDRTMPLLNKTGMTEEERALLGRWAESGASGRE